jgi:hypothetical protein
VSGLAFSGLLDRMLSSIYDPEGSLTDRVSILTDTIPLIDDYIFTGSGLMTFPLVHSTYGMLAQISFQPHSHNTYLEVWLEQGVVGFLALAWGVLVAANWAWRALERATVPIFGWAGLAAGVVIAIHGLFDVVFYIERTLPLIGFSLGFAYLAVRPDPLSIKPSHLHKKSFIVIITPAILAIIAVIIFLRPLAGAWHANLGALIQTRLELSHYNPEQFEKLSLDTIRRSTNLLPVQSEYKQALEWDPANRTALQRLSGIAMSMGEYNDALKYASVAWQLGYQDYRTRLLLGDALVAAGQVDEAAKILKGLPHAVFRLWGQALYRYWLSSAPDYQRSISAWTTILLLDPSDKGAFYSIQQAEKLLQNSQP